MNSSLVFSQNHIPQAFDHSSSFAQSFALWVVVEHIVDSLVDFAKATNGCRNAVGGHGVLSLLAKQPHPHHIHKRLVPDKGGYFSRVGGEHFSRVPPSMPTPKTPHSPSQCCLNSFPSPIPVAVACALAQAAECTNGAYIPLGRSEQGPRMPQGQLPGGVACGEELAHASYIAQTRGWPLHGGCDGAPRSGAGGPGAYAGGGR